MPIIFIAENNEYNPLEFEPYKSFNKKFEDREDDLEGALIKISIPNHRKGFVDGSSSENSILIHHTIEYDFDTSFVEIQQDMAEEFKSRAEHIYIPGVKQLELSYRLTSKSVQLIFDVVTEEKSLQTICNQLISHDVAIFSRGW